MERSLSRRITLGALAAIVGASLAACGGAAPPAANTAAAAEVTAAWTAAFNGGDSAALAALYAEDAHSRPTEGAPIVGRSAIESYWRQDMGSGGAVTTLTPGASIGQGDLLHVDGTYDVAGQDGVTLAKGQYEQLWARADGQWRIEQDTWRLDASPRGDVGRAGRLSSLWTTAYNARNTEGLMALYDQDAELSTEPTQRLAGRDAIGAFWSADFASGTASTTLTLTDAYMAGNLAHLEGEYEVSDGGTVTKGHYVQLWMQDGEAWRIRREIWWR